VLFRSRAGMETVAFCEYDKKARLVLKKHWPEIPIYDDIRQLTGKQIAEDIGTVDLICGGFPCQPFSVAGKQRGDQDDRHLWPEMFRLIQEIRPRWVIGENVAGLINMGLDQVLSDLESADYSTETLIIPACAVNAPHRRDRVWIVANSDGRGTQVRRAESNQILSSRRENPNLLSAVEKSSEHVSSSPGPGLQKRERVRPIRSWAHPAIKALSQWDVEPQVGRVVNGFPGRVDQLKQLGNSVVPQVVEIIGGAIMEIENAI